MLIEKDERPMNEIEHHALYWQNQQSNILPRTSLTISGFLPGGRYLAYPLDVKVAYDDGEVIVSEPHFHLHATGATVEIALTEFRHILIEELDALTADEAELGPRLQAELRYLRNLIRTA